MEENDFVSHLCPPRHGESSATVTSNRKHSRRKRTRSLVRSKSHHDVTINQPLNPELSVDNRSPGLLKIFGESLVAGTRYKSVLASTRSTAQELIKQALDRYGIASRLYKDFVLCESIGKTISANYCEGDSECRIDKRKDKKGVKSSFSSIVNQSSLPNSSSCANTPRSARSIHGRKIKKILNDDQSPCGSPRGNCDSLRTPLGSPRTPCGSPSTSRGSPRTSVVYHVGKSAQDDLESINYRPPKVLDSSSYGHHRILLKCGRSGNDSPRIINNLDSPRQNIRSPRAVNSVQLKNGSHQNQGDWIQVYFRVLSYSDRPLELQEFWKPPDGLSRRYELRRRRDVTMDAVDNETTGLNDNARKIMISKVSPGVIPFTEPRETAASRTVLKDEWNRAAAALTNASLTYTEDNDTILTNVVEGDPQQAYVCPSIYPYLLTLRGCSIQKDLVLYPLKSRSLSIGSAEKNVHTDDIQLSSQDVNLAHCRVSLKRLPQDEKSVDESKRIYWYCLDLEIFGTSFVTVNGIQVRQKATMFPGDLLGIGRQYLFLYKDPTGGHDIPSAVPWLPENETEASAIYSQVIRHRENESRENPSGLPRSHQIKGHHMDTPYQDEDSNILDDSAARDTAVFLAYHRDKEMELLECISEVECHSKGDYPLSQALLFLASHQYAARKFSGNHQTSFFKRLVRVIRARVGVVSKLVSQQKHESPVFSSDNSTKTTSDVDYFPCLVNWLSNVLTLLDHFRTSHFQSFVGGLARRNDVTKSVQEAVGYFEETVSFLFQQVVYSVTKVLYEPINKFMQNALPDNHKPSNEALQRILFILQAVRRLITDLLVKQEVANQLMVYLLFFVSTTLFNRIIAKGSKLYNRESGTALQEGISALESWAKGAGLEQEFVRVSEHILSLVDLLSSSKRTLMRLDWQKFQNQFSPLTDIQLCKVLGEYNLGDGVTSPESWCPPQPIDAKQDLTVSLSSHPPFVLPKYGEQVNLQDTFSSEFYRHLEQVQQRFSLVGEDANCSGLSSAGNTPRLSDSINRSSNLDPFFSQDPNSSLSGGSSHLYSEHLKSSQIVSKSQPKNHDENDGTHNEQTQLSAKRVPPQTAPKPKTSQSGVKNNEAAIHRALAPPPYNMAIKLKQRAQSQENLNRNQTTHKHMESSKHPKGYPVLLQHNAAEDSNEPKSKHSFLSNLKKFKTLPDNIKDKLFAKPNISNSQPHRSQRGKSNHLITQQSWTPGMHQIINTNHISQMNTNDLSSTYPITRQRPSSATDCVQYLADGSNHGDFDLIPGPFMNPQQREELLTTRSNSALGYKHDGKNYLQRQSSIPDGNLHNSRGRDQRENILHPPNYEHVKDSTCAINDTNPHIFKQNSLNTHVMDSQSKESLSKSKEFENGLFTYGSLKRSPRNTNLSKRTSSDNKLNETTPGSKGLTQSGNTVSGSDVPPPLPPRGEAFRIRSSFDSQNESARDKARESPLGSALSSSQRNRSGSRTSVEIQDITENQYIIYNPESPVKEFFDFNQNYLSMVNRNNVGENGHKQNECNQDANRKLTRVPPLDLPDDLLGVSENDSQDEVFNYSSDKDFINERRNISHKMPGLFGSSENVQHVNHTGIVNTTRRMSSVDEYPDDVYIDVNNLSNSDSTGSSTLKVLPLSDEGRRAITNDHDSGAVFVRYRHTMPDTRDISNKGEVTGEVFTVTLTKTGNKLGMGLIDGLHTPLKLPGIYVRNVLPDTPAALCGCLRVGDRLLSINGKSIVGVDYNSAMKMIHSTGPKLDLMVAKCDRSIASKISASTA